MTNWLGVASAEHVRRGVALGIAQIGHGKRVGLARMKPADTLIYYSPRERLGASSQLQHFTAIGSIADDEIWQADEGAFQPFRRRVEYSFAARSVHLEELRGALDFTNTANWGYQLRRGLITLNEHDASVLRSAMLTPRHG